MLKSVKIDNVDFSIEYLKSVDLDVIVDELPDCAMRGKLRAEKRKLIKEVRDKHIEKKHTKEGGE